jgi:hypothetical protein
MFSCWRLNDCQIRVSNKQRADDANMYRFVVASSHPVNCSVRLVTQNGCFANASKMQQESFEPPGLYLRAVAGRDQRRNAPCDELIRPGPVTDSRLSWRSFGLMTVAAAGISSAALAQSNVVEKDVELKTADGTCDVGSFPSGRHRKLAGRAGLARHHGPEARRPACKSAFRGAKDSSAGANRRHPAVAHGAACLAGYQELDELPGRGGVA